MCKLKCWRERGWRTILQPQGLREVDAVREECLQEHDIRWVGERKTEQADLPSSPLSLRAFMLHYLALRDIAAVLTCAACCTNDLSAHSLRAAAGK